MPSFNPPFPLTSLTLQVLRSLPPKDLRGKLVVDVLSIKELPRKVSSGSLPATTTCLCLTASPALPALPSCHYLPCSPRRKLHVKVMLEVLPEDCDVIASHPMFGPESAAGSWQGLPFVYEQVPPGRA